MERKRIRCLFTPSQTCLRNKWMVPWYFCKDFIRDYEFVYLFSLGGFSNDPFLQFLLLWCQLVTTILLCWPIPRMPSETHFYKGSSISSRPHFVSDFLSAIWQTLLNVFHAASYQLNSLEIVFLNEVVQSDGSRKVFFKITGQSGKQFDYQSAVSQFQAALTAKGDNDIRAANGAVQVKGKHTNYRNWWNTLSLRHYRKLCVGVFHNSPPNFCRKSAVESWHPVMRKFGLKWSGRILEGRINFATLFQSNFNNESSNFWHGLSDVNYFLELRIFHVLTEFTNGAFVSRRNASPNCDTNAI